MRIRYLHTMVRVKDLETSKGFYELLGLRETDRKDVEAGRFTLVFMAPPGQQECPVELTYNWDGDDALPDDSRHFGHLAYSVEQYLRDVPAFAGQWRDDQPPAARRAHGLCPQPRQYLGRVVAGGRGVEAAEPWASMENTGHW